MSSAPRSRAVRVEDRGHVRVLTLDRPERRNALDLASRLAELSAPMVAGTRRLLDQPDQSLDGVLEAEADLQVELLAGRQFAEGRSAFLERRRPDFIGA